MANYIQLPGLIRKLKKSGYPDIDLTRSDEEALLEGCYFDEDLGWRPVDYLSFFCRHSTGDFKGQPFDCVEWQAERLLVPVFGWLRPNGLRRIRKSVVFVPKKQGKSTLCAGLVPYLLDPVDGDRENGAQVYLAATTKDQAAIVYKEAANMVDVSPELRAKFTPLKAGKTIEYNLTTFCRALSADANSNEGPNAHGLVLDEIHAWTNADFYGALVGAGAMRTQPLIFIISTAGKSLDSIGGEEYLYAKKILRGDVVDTTVWPLIFEADPSDDLDDPEIWKKANPSLGHSMPIERFAEDYHTAKQKGGKTFSDFKRYRFNIWGGADSPYINLKHWNEKCVEKFTQENLAGMDCFAGLDLSSKEDITSACYNFPIDGEYKMLWRHWVPGDKVAENLERGERKYLDWVNSGHLIQIPGARIEQDLVMDQIEEDLKQFNCLGFAVESWNAQGIIDRLQKLLEDVVEVTPSYKHYSEPTKEFKSLITSGLIKHQGTEIMEMMVSNLHIKENNFLDVMPMRKDRNRKYKIDGCIAAILALKLAIITKEEEKFRSRYEDEEATLFLR